MVKLFVTGGAGFVGSHCIAELLSGTDENGNGENLHIVVVDNMINSVIGKVNTNFDQFILLSFLQCKFFFFKATTANL